MSIGECVQEAIVFEMKGAFERAYFPTAMAIVQTVAKITNGDGRSELAIQRFIRENFTLITFMGMQRALPLPLKVPFALKRLIPTFNSLHGVEEIVTLTITETLKYGRLPEVFAAGSTGTFEVHDGRLWMPSGLVRGLLGSVIFNQVNHGEIIAEDCWISISDFRMFVSELFGRQDLAERIMKFYSF